MEHKKISSQYPSRSYGNRQQPEKKVKKAEGQNIFARSGRAVKKKFRIFSIRAGMDMPFFLLIMVILCIGLVMLFSASYANAYYVYGDSYYFIKDQALFAVLGRIRAKALRYVAKLLVFNAAMALEVLLSVYLLGIPFESFAILGPLGPVLLAVLANVVFIVFDRALEGLIVQYLHRLHPRMAKILRGK